MNSELLNSLKSKGYSVVDTQSVEFSEELSNEGIVPKVSRGNQRYYNENASLDLEALTTAGSVLTILLATTGINIANSQEMKELFIRAQGIGIGALMIPLALIASRKRK